MNERARALPWAAGYLTRLPVRHRGEAALGPVVGWFPLVGAAVGACCALVWIAALEVLPASAAAVAAIATGVVITGAFHLDGLADSMDALVGGWTPQQRRELLKDPLHGTYGVTAIVLQLGLQWSLLAGLGGREGVAALIAAHTLGRAGAVWTMPFAKSVAAGLGADAVGAVRSSDVAVATVTALVVATASVGVGVVPLVAAVLMAALLVTRWGVIRLGGVTGDVLGAAEQVGETVVLLGVVVMVARGVEVPWW